MSVYTYLILVFLCVAFTSCEQTEKIGADDGEISRTELYQIARQTYVDNGIDPKYLHISENGYQEYLRKVSAGQPALQEMKLSIAENKERLLEINRDFDIDLRDTKYQAAMPDKLEEKLKKGFESQEEFTEWAKRYPEYMAGDGAGNSGGGK